MYTDTDEDNQTDTHMHRHTFLCAYKNIIRCNAADDESPCAQEI